MLIYRIRCALAALTVGACLTACGDDSDHAKSSGSDEDANEPTGSDDETRDDESPDVDEANPESGDDHPTTSDGGKPTGSASDAGTQASRDATVPGTSSACLNTKTVDDLKAEYGADSSVFAAVSGGAVASTARTRAAEGELFGPAMAEPTYPACGKEDVLNNRTHGCTTFEYLSRTVCPEYGVMISVSFRTPTTEYTRKDAADLLFLDHYQQPLLSCISRYALTTKPAGFPAICKECFWPAVCETARDIGVAAQRD